MVEVVTLTPKSAGKREIIASLNTDQLVGINGTIMVEIERAPQSSRGYGRSHAYGSRSWSNHWMNWSH